MCSHMLLVFLFAFFLTSHIFTLLATSISHFLTAGVKFSCCSPNEISHLCFFFSFSLFLLELRLQYFRQPGYRNNFRFLFCLYWLFYCLSSVTRHGWPCDFPSKNLELQLGCLTCWLSLWYERTVARSVYGHVITKFSRMDRLPNFLSYGAPLWRRLQDIALLMKKTQVSNQISLYLPTTSKHHKTFSFISIAKKKQHFFVF